MALVHLSTVTLLLAAIAVSVNAAPAEGEAASPKPETSSYGGTALVVDHSRTFLPPPCRPGLCPYIKKVVPESYSQHHDHDDEHNHPAPSLCGNLCNHDNACPIGQKCCATNCGYVCHEAVIVHVTLP